MSWRSVLEDASTVKCKGCGVEFVDPGKWPSGTDLRIGNILDQLSGSASRLTSLLPYFLTSPSPGSNVTMV